MEPTHSVMCEVPQQGEVKLPRAPPGGRAYPCLEGVKVEQVPISQSFSSTWGGKGKAGALFNSFPVCRGETRLTAMGSSAEE